MSILDLIGTAATGGIVGVVGNGLAAITGYIQAKQAHAQKIAELRLSMEAARDANAAAAFTASQAHAGAGRGTESRWVTNILCLVRPVLCGLLLGLLTCIWWRNTDPALNATLANEVVFLTSAAVGWYFASRPNRGALSKMESNPK